MFCFVYYYYIIIISLMLKKSLGFVESIHLPHLFLNEVLRCQLTVTFYLCPPQKKGS